MSVRHLDTLHEQLPELFEARPQPRFDEVIAVPVDDPESVNTQGNSRSDQIEGHCAQVLEPGTPLPELPSIVGYVPGGSFGGAPLAAWHGSEMPPPEALAFYLPFHHYHPAWWGVYLHLEGVLWLAGEIVRRSPSVPRYRAMLAARLFLFYHEAFHHKTECFATRLELTHRKAFYRTGFTGLYTRTLGTADCMEEGLANASALNDVNRKLEKLFAPDLEYALEGYVTDSPPGYAEGVWLREGFLDTKCEFAELNHCECLPALPPKKPEIWRTAPYLFDGIASIKSRVKYLLPRGSPLARRLPIRLL